MAAVVVVGSGLAGLLAAVRAADAGHRVTVVTKGTLDEGSTRHAQGGIAAALFADDSVDAHVRDTLRAGAGHCDPAAVRVLCEEGPARVRDLIRFGAAFDRDESGLARGLEAAHSRARVVHAGGDATGAEIQRALVATVRSRAVELVEHAMLADVLTCRGRACGVRLLIGGQYVDRPADAVVLATGGTGQLYGRTTNPAVATGDGVAAAWRAGARVDDLEFTQFHPTALAAPGTPLISEAVRGEGAVLRDASGERFMPSRHPLAELAPRDVVAREVAAAMRRHGDAPATLDATALGAAFLARRFPGIDAATRAAGYDWSREPVPVTPAAHYAMGGIATDLWGRTSVPGLFAIGECARTGVHGANRLASNSLLEAAVFADRAGRVLGEPFPHAHAASRAQLRTEGAAPRSSAAGPFTRAALQDLMWTRAGLERSGDGLAGASALLDDWALAQPAEPAPAVEAIEDANLLLLARLTVDAALARRESRGAHHRLDHPERDPALGALPEAA